MNPEEIQKAFFPFTQEEIEAALDPWGILKQMKQLSSGESKVQEKEEEPQPKPWDAVLGDGEVKSS